VATVAIASELNGVHANLVYYSTSNVRAVSEALGSSRFSDEDRDIIKILMRKQKSFPPRDSQPQRWQPQERVDVLTIRVLPLLRWRLI
jgi:hypothetical protein